MKALLSGLINPISIFLILVLLAVIQIRRGKGKSSMRYAVISIVWFLIISTSFLPNLLISFLENRYPVFNSKTLLPNSAPVNILVLGAGAGNDSRFPATNNLSETAMSRLSEGIRLQRLIPGSTLITSAAGEEGELSQSEISAQAAMQLGVDSAHIKIQKKPENTWQEAQEYKRLFGDSTRLILVTSATHMPRAMYLFQKTGLNPIPAPANHLIKKGKHVHFWYWLPSAENIRRMEIAVHEYVGMGWARIGGC